MVLDTSPVSRFQLQPLLHLDPSPENPTLSRTISEYIIGCVAENKARYTISAYADRLADFTKTLTGMGFRGDITQITTRHIRLYLVALQERKLQSSTVNAYFRVLRTFFNRQFEEGNTPQNPIAPIKPPRVERKIPRVLFA